jgi:hypothetical protein
MTLAYILLLAAAASAAPQQSWQADLRRAKQRTPGPAYRGQGSLALANARLNGHLTRQSGLKVKACEDFSVHELRSVLRTLLPQASRALQEIYPESDGRRAAYTSVEDMEADWAQSAPAEDPRVHAAHCHEAVMWFVHHLSSEAKVSAMKQLVLPLLPVEDHTAKQSQRDIADVAGRFYDQKITCQKCHVGGIDSLGLPEVAPTTARAKARRCYTNYKDMFNITCEPCDGIAGPYWGDSDDDFKPTECHVVGTPEDIPDHQRVHAKLPEQFSVDVVWGSDRFGRTTNPVHDQLPGPIAKIYGQISGKWYMDAKPGADLWLLRHDTTYAEVTENGVNVPFIKPQVTEIHAQTAKQRASNITGPMVSLIHGMPSWVPGGCTCMPDPVGVPDITSSWAQGMANMQYMGRIRLPELEQLKEPIVLDHWANWFFHIFMDVNKSVPHYGRAPSRLASAYAGMAVYANWQFGDPAALDPAVWTRGIPTSPEKVGPSKGLMCMNTKKSDICANITQTTFPPKGEPAEPRLPAATLEKMPQSLPRLSAALALGEHWNQFQQQRPHEVLV